MRRLVAATLAVTTLAVSACGSGDDDAAPTTPTTPSETGDPATGDPATGDPSSSSEPPAPECDPDAAPATTPAGTDGAASPDPDRQAPDVEPPATIPTELVVEDLRPGHGPEAAVGDTVIVDYVGIRSEDGAVFDSSYAKPIPFDFPLGRGGVIQGWEQGLLGAQAGTLRRLDVPAELAYGDNPPASDVIRPGDALTFVIEVRAVIETVTVADAPLDLEIEPSLDAAGLVVDDIELGDGATVDLGDTVVVHLLLVRGDNEVVLFNSWERDDPLQIVMQDGQTLPGIFEGLRCVTVGTLRVMRMPPDLAFGPGGEPSLGLPPETDLIVVAEVVGVY